MDKYSPSIVKFSGSKTYIVDMEVKQEVMGISPHQKTVYAPFIPYGPLVDIISSYKLIPKFTDIMIKNEADLAASFTIDKANRIELGVELDYTIGGDRMLALSGTLVSILNTVQSLDGSGLNISGSRTKLPSPFASKVDKTVFYLFQVDSNYLTLRTIFQF
jgi:hypothetical protein